MDDSGDLREQCLFLGFANVLYTDLYLLAENASKKNRISVTQNYVKILKDFSVIGSKAIPKNLEQSTQSHKKFVREIVISQFVKNHCIADNKSVMEYITKYFFATYRRKYNPHVEDCAKLGAIAIFKTVAFLIKTILETPKYLNMIMDSRDQSSQKNFYCFVAVKVVEYVEVLSTELAVEETPSESAKILSAHTKLREEYGKIVKLLKQARAVIVEKNKIIEEMRARPTRSPPRYERTPERHATFEPTYTYTESVEQIPTLPAIADPPQIESTVEDYFF